MDQWLAGESILDRWDLQIPAEATGGRARLEVAVDGGKETYLADIDVAAVAHTFQLPPAVQVVRAAFGDVGELAGYELASAQVSSGQAVDLTLYWRAAGTPSKDYVVFAQLLTEQDRLVGQSDSRPAQGQRPTRGWLADEIIGDAHLLSWTDKDFEGEAKIIVGLYDPVTLERVPVRGQSRDYVTLPAAIRVVKP
jgi:hypothetical protein